MLTQEVSLHSVVVIVEPEQEYVTYALPGMHSMSGVEEENRLVLVRVCTLIYIYVGRVCDDD